MNKAITIKARHYNLAIAQEYIGNRAVQPPVCGA